MARIKKQLNTHLTLYLILFLAAFLRLYRIADYMTFLGDEGRDVLVVKRMLVDHKFTLLGPTASVGGFFLGPIYYYFIAPFLWLFRFNPVGPAVMVALVGVATVFLVYQFCREFLDEKTGLLAAFLYAVSTLIIKYSRSSWNPNVLPFFSLLLIYSLAKAIFQNQKKYFWLVGLCFGIVFQLHYMAVLLVPSFFLIYLFLYQEKELLKDFSKLFFGFLITFSPFFLFELRHNFPNCRSLFNFILKGKEVGLLSTQIDSEVIHNHFFALVSQLFRQTLAYNHQGLGKVIILVVLIGLFLEFLKPKITQKRLLFFFFLLISSLILGKLYKRAIYDYYLAYLFPYPAIIFSLAFWRIVKSWRWFLIGGLFLLFFILQNDYQTNILRTPANRQMLQTKKIAQIILKEAQGKPFNFALIAQGNSDHAYRYFLELGGNSPVVIENPQVDPQRKTVTDQLFVVCEVPPDYCHPLGHSLWEIAGFGRAEISNQWQAPGGITIMKLVHYQGND